jgi:hypothetical protein
MPAGLRHNPWLPTSTGTLTDSGRYIKEKMHILKLDHYLETPSTAGVTQDHANNATHCVPRTLVADIKIE